MQPSFPSHNKYPGDLFEWDFICDGVLVVWPVRAVTLSQTAEYVKVGSIWTENKYKNLLFYSILCWLGALWYCEMIKNNQFQFQKMSFFFLTRDRSTNTFIVHLTRPCFKPVQRSSGLNRGGGVIVLSGGPWGWSGRTTCSSAGGTGGGGRTGRGAAPSNTTRPPFWGAPGWTVDPWKEREKNEEE